MRSRSVPWLCFLTTLAIGAAGHAIGQYQMLPSLFPEGVPGYDDAPGVTVMSRLHPELMPARCSLRDAAHLSLARRALHGVLASIVLGNATIGGRSAAVLAVVTTAPSLVLGTDWSRKPGRRFAFNLP